MNGKTAAIALVMTGAAMVLPAQAAPGPTVQAAATPGRAQAQRQAERVRSARPLVMLVCREVRAGRRGEAPRAADLACVTRWAGL